MSASRCPLLLVLALSLMAPACRKPAIPSPDESKSAASAEAAEEGPAAAEDSDRDTLSNRVAGYRVDELTAIGSYLPALDEGRLRVAPPIDWSPASRSRKYIARFVLDRNVALPRITVEAEPAGDADPRHLTEQGATAYAEWVMSRMDEGSLDDMEGRVEPILLGGIPCARYVLRRGFRKGERLLPGRREVVQTIRDGRVYRVVLDVYAGTLVKYRADAYAVLANMQFPLSGASEESEEQGAKKAQTTKGSEDNGATE